VNKKPEDNYGQSVTYADGVLRTISNVVRNHTVKVPCFTLDSLMSNHNIGHIDLIDMDVQGNEVRVVNGAKSAIEAERIDYWKIGTHGSKYNWQLRAILLRYYDLIVDILPYSVGGVDGLKAKVEDGIQVYKRKGL
jgi:hypothetical protein